MYYNENEMLALCCLLDKVREKEPLDEVLIKVSAFEIKVRL